MARIIGEKTAGCLSKGVGESLTREDAVADVAKHAAQTGVAPALVAQRLQRLVHRHACG
jgi:hypothetical protein